MEIGRVQVLECEMRVEGLESTDDVYSCRRVHVFSDFKRDIIDSYRWGEREKSLKSKGIYMDKKGGHRNIIYISEHNPFYNAPMLWSRFRERNFQEIGQLVYNEAQR